MTNCEERLGGRGIRMEDETNLNVLPILHEHDVHLVDDEQLDGGEEVRIPARRESARALASGGVPDSLLLFDTRSESKRTRNNHVAAVELGEELDRLPRHLHAEPEAIVDVPPERLDVVGSVVSWVLNELVDRSFGEGELAIEPRLVLDRVGLRDGREEVDPGESRVAEGEEDEDFGSGEALILGVAGRSGRGGIGCDACEVVVVFENTGASSARRVQCGPGLVSGRTHLRTWFIAWRAVAARISSW